MRKEASCAHRMQIMFSTQLQCLQIWKRDQEEEVETFTRHGFKLLPDMVSNFRMKAIMRIVFTVNRLGTISNTALKKTHNYFQGVGQSVKMSHLGNICPNSSIFGLPLKLLNLHTKGAQDKVNALSKLLIIISGWDEVGDKFDEIGT